MEDIKHGMKMLTPAADWRDAIPTGNGPMCAMVYGGISPETVLYNHDALWVGAKRTQVPDVAEFLPVVRQMLLEGRFEEANSFYADRMRERGFAGAMPSLHPAFDLRVRMPQAAAFKNYSRSLDFATGQATVAWTDDGKACRRDFFVSRAVKNLSAIRLRREGGGIHAGFALCEHSLMNLIDMAGVAQKLPFHYSTSLQDGMLVLTATGSDGGDFGAVLRLYARGGAVAGGRSESWAQQQTALAVMWGWEIPELDHLMVTGADEVTAVVAMFVNTPAAQAVPALITQLKACDGDYDALFAAHCEKHTPLFTRCTLEVDAPAEGGLFDGTNEQLLLEAYQGDAPARLVSRLYDMGRYLLISCTDADANPPTLQGSWNGDYYPAWNSFYVHNENTQMFYWQALAGSIPETTWAMTNYFERFLDDYRQNAKNLFGCRGIFIPLTADAGTGLLQDPQAHVIYFTGVAPWVAQHFYDYWLFTRDRAFLEDHAWPFIRECARFYADYLELDAEGFTRIMPSNSPENAPRSSIDIDFNENAVMNPGVPLTINATIDVALVREVFTNTLACCEALGADEAEAPRWRELLAKLRPFRINSDGALAEWVHADHLDNYAHRHLSHIYPLFPGFQITRETPELFDAVGVAMEKRMTVGLEALTGWSLAHQANIYARMQRPGKAKNCLDILCRTCLGPNLLTYHNDDRNMGATLNIILNLHKPYQADAIMGVAGAVTEMLVYSYPGTLRLLPALPKGFEKGRMGTLTTRDGVKLDLAWDMAAGTLTAGLEAAEDTTFRLELPEGFTCGQDTVTLAKGQKLALAATR